MLICGSLGEDSRTMQWVLTVVYSIVCFLLVSMVLLQRGKDAAGGLFGSGSSAVLSSHGTTSFLVRATSILGALFFLLSLALGVVINRQVDQLRLQEVVQAVDDTAKDKSA